MPTVIHPTALVTPGAQLGENVTVGAFAFIGPEAVIGDGCVIQHHATVENLTILGRDNILHPYAFVGGMTQDKKFEGGMPGLKVGDRNVFREYVSVHIATKPGDFTIVGDENFLLAYSHIAHECQVGNNNILSSHSALGGHVVLGNHVNIGWNAGIHQFCHIGSRAMIGACSKVTQDVPPYMMCDGNPGEVVFINKVGLTRAGFNEEEVMLARTVFKLLYRSKLNRAQALAEIENLPLSNHAIVKDILAFVSDSKRGLA